MSKKIQFTLTPESIRKAIIEVETYELELRQKLNELIRRLGEEGADIARMKVAAMDAVFTGQLLDSISQEYIGGGYYSQKTGVAIIRAGIWYAAFVEYGTGVVGARSPHPNPDGWVYDVNGHGESGWVYLSDNDSKLHWTNGVPARPFMYETAKALEELCMDIARGMFGK